MFPPVQLKFPICPNKCPDEKGMETLLGRRSSCCASPRPNKCPDEKGMETAGTGHPAGGHRGPNKCPDEKHLLDLSRGEQGARGYDRRRGDPGARGSITGRPGSGPASGQRREPTGASRPPDGCYFDVSASTSTAAINWPQRRTELRLSTAASQRPGDGRA